MSKHFSRLPRRRQTTPLLLLGALAGSGCGSTDGSRLLQPGGGYGGGGASGAAGGGSGGSAGTGGSGGTAVLSDAGRDASTDASSNAASCVVGPLDQYCALGVGYCPTDYAEARAKLRQAIGAMTPLLILQQSCTAPDGSGRVRVSGVYDALSQSYIYEPASGQLVSVQRYDDLGGCADSTPPGAGFGSVHGFYGEDLPGCSLSYSSFVVPPDCHLPPNWRESDAGAPLDAGTDAGTSPYECILAP